MNPEDIELEFHHQYTKGHTHGSSRCGPEVAKQMLINAIQSSVSDSVKTMYRDYIRERENNLEENEWYKALINIGGESK